MGIKGLQEFLSHNEQYLATRVSLSDTSLVIDVYHLFIFLRKKISPNGDLVSYAQSVREFFKCLKQCNIEPVLIFGVPILNDARQEESIAVFSPQERDLQQFNVGIRADRFNGELIPAAVLKNIIMNVAIEMGVERRQVSFNHIARVANELECPVLTNDASFIIYNLERGFIMFDFFEYDRAMREVMSEATAGGAIKCSLFKRSRLIESVPQLSPEVLPLLSILLDTNHISAGTFEGFLLSICHLRHDGILEARNYYQRRILKVLTWMRQGSLHELINSILNSINNQQIDRSKLKRLLESRVREHQFESSQDLEQELTKIYPSNRVADPSEQVTPVEFLMGLLEHDNLYSIAYDMLFHKTHYHYPVVLDEPSDRLSPERCIECRPYSLALVLLRPQSQAGDQVTAFHMEHQQANGAYLRVPIGHMDSLDNFGPLNHLDCYSMLTLEKELKRKMLMDCFYFNSDELHRMKATFAHAFSGPFVEEAALCFILLKYIRRQTQIQPELYFVDALLLTIFYYATLSDNINRGQIYDSEALRRILDTLMHHSLIRNGDTYNESLDRRITHSIGQLFSAYKAFCLINSLLNYPFEMPRLERFLNATLLFRLAKLFCSGEPTLFAIYRRLHILGYYISRDIRSTLI
uniref:Protein asteroid 1 n=1 Tax=Aceria tosichella TaxID=561515 RepID=A0A6G1SBD3_9ACAR